MQPLNVEYSGPLGIDEARPPLRVVENLDFDRPLYRGDIHRVKLTFSEEQRATKPKRDLGFI